MPQLNEFDDRLLKYAALSVMAEYYEQLMGKKPPKFKVEIFDSKAVTQVKWSEVVRRRIGIKGFIGYDLIPIMRINRVLLHTEIPENVLISTIMEEMVHLELGWGKLNPHDEEFFNLATKCPEFASGLLWKEQNAMKVVELCRNMRER